MGATETNASRPTAKTATPEEYDASTSLVDASIVKQTTQNGSDVFHNVKLDKLPDYAELKKQVDAEVARMTWWEAYGVDSLVHFLGAVGAVCSFFLMRSDSAVVFVLGVVLLGCCHSVLSVKGGHLAAHKAAVRSAPLNRLLGFFFSDVCGTFPSDSGITIHIKEHHPYTNIIGIGDSSTWKVPFVPSYLYMFVTPFLVPVITPFRLRGNAVGRVVQAPPLHSAGSLGDVGQPVPLRQRVRLDAVAVPGHDGGDPRGPVRALHPRQHLPAHRPAHVHTEGPAQEDLPDVHRGPQPVAQPRAGLLLRPQHYQVGAACCCHEGVGVDGARVGVVGTGWGWVGWSGARVELGRWGWGGLGPGGVGSLGVRPR